MTEPTPEVILTAEHQAVADALYERIREYQREHYQPAAGWPKESLAYEVRAALDRASSLPDVINVDAESVTGLTELIESSLAGYSKLGHKHPISDLEGVSTTPVADSLVRRDSTGGVQVNEPTSGSNPTTLSFVNRELAKKAPTQHNHTIGSITGLQGVLDTKSSSTHIHNIQDIVGLSEALESAGSSIDPEVLKSKADLVSGRVPLAQIPSIPIAQVLSLRSELDSKPSLLNGKIKKTDLPSLNYDDVEGLKSFVDSQANNVKLTDGKVSREVLPQGVFDSVINVSSISEMTSLSETQATDGDIAFISSGSSMGAYQLMGPPGSLSSWNKFPVPSSVSSVNGKKGEVVLSATDVGARPSSTSVPQSEVEGLIAALEAKASKTDLAGLVKSSELTSLRTEMANQNYSYPSVDYVSTNRVLSLSGQQSIDGTLVPVGRRVLLTAQSSSAQNGIWVVSTSSWYRDPSMLDNSVVPKGALVTVTSGKENGNTLWQMRNSNSAVVGTESQNWNKILTAGSSGVDFTPGDGLALSGSTLSVKAGSGITVNSSGVSLDTSGLMRKFAANVPSGSSVATVTHNLNTRDVYVSIYETSTGDQVLAGVTISGVNAVAIEFATAPTSNQYRAVIFG